MSRVMVKVTGFPLPPFEASVLVDADDVPAVLGAIVQRTPWTCRMRCRSIVTRTGVYRQINPRCARHCSLIPSEVSA